ncbi:MAG: hypothetical protein IKL51_07220 [Lachnospiraceae bacterium]|nr:hypothetical protein [Lachnospiraceae bacterium]
MPKIKSYDWESSITFELNLKDGKGLIYDKNQADYLNWIPYDFYLIVRNNMYILEGMTFSLEGIKTFLLRLQSVIDERNIKKEYVEYEYCASEAEFSIYLKNTDDYYEDEIVLTKLWINAAYLENAGSGYCIGFDFIIRYEDLKVFTEELKKELNEIVRK